MISDVRATTAGVRVEPGGEFWGWAWRTLGAPARTATGRQAWLRLVSSPEDKVSGKLWDGTLDAQHAFGDLDGRRPASWLSVTLSTTAPPTGRSHRHRTPRAPRCGPPTNPLEGLSREIKRRSDVVQVFPNTGAVTRLATVVLVELHDEWIAFPRRYLSIESMDSLYPDDTACLHGTGRIISCTTTRDMTHHCTAWAGLAA